MSRHSRLAAAVAALGLTAVLTGCAEEPEVVVADPPPPPASTPAPAAPAPTASGGAPAVGGVTTVADVHGPACDQVPQQGEGSVQGMVDDAVATAVGDNPLLSTLVQALRVTGLTDALDDPGASYTVFAPADPAFATLPPATLQQLLADPQGRLTDVLTYHVVPQRYDAEGLAAAGTVTTVQGDELVVSGEPTALVIDEQERATVLCGNVPTANATVFVIDTVLMPDPA